MSSAWHGMLTTRSNTTSIAKPSLRSLAVLGSIEHHSPSSTSSQTSVAAENMASYPDIGLDPDVDAGPSTWQRFSKKFKVRPLPSAPAHLPDSLSLQDEPLVPLGAGLTTIALIGAGSSLRRGDSSSFNLWLRARVVLQGLTIAAALGGSVYYTADKAKIAAAKKALEEREREKRGAMLDRMREQELASSGRTLPPLPMAPSLPNKNPENAAPQAKRNKKEMKEDAEIKRAWIRKKMAESAKEEGRALRLPTPDDYRSSSAGTASVEGEKAGSDRLV